ncbi:MAG: nucleotidyltransferase domain-containing protein [Nanoarchaeota archaeon]|nr:nucleotidyltransferase domain-containing protein [Nanoarchaeota archaeon]
MRTNIIIYALGSEKRRRIVKTILEYPDRLWSCTQIEETAKVPHATAFRAITAMKDFGILKTTKINKRDLIYHLVKESPLTEELERVLNINKITSRKIAKKLIARIKDKIHSAILYGSSVTGKMKPDSDLDIMIIVKKHDKETERKIFDESAEISFKVNKTISPIIMELEEIRKEKNTAFIKSVRENMEIIYGKTPF